MPCDNHRRLGIAVQPVLGSEFIAPADTVVTALADGRRAAQAIQRYLQSL